MTRPSPIIHGGDLTARRKEGLAVERETSHHGCMIKAIFAFLLFASAVRAADPLEAMAGGPETAARVFLSELRRHQVTGLPGEGAWEALAPLFSESLAALMEAARKEQLEHQRKFPDEKPPWIEGDLFSSLFEGPHRFHVGAAMVEGERATIPILYERTEAGETVRWKDSLILVKTSQGWSVDDVRYGGTWDFANQGTLKEALAAE